MYFKIQISNPAIEDCSNQKREDLSSAIFAAFPQATEDAIMVWNWVPIRINYSCDLSVIIENVLLMLSDLLQFDKGSRLTSFGANTFRAVWSLYWAGGNLTVDASWESIAGSYENLLNSRRTLKVPQAEFLIQWKALLKKVIEAIDYSGIKIQDKKQIGTLRGIEAAIPKAGGRTD